MELRVKLRCVTMHSSRHYAVGSSSFSLLGFVCVCVGVSMYVGNNKMVSECFGADANLSSVVKRN